MASSGTQTSVMLMRGWSVGMLKVHIHSSILIWSAGTRKTVMPDASPSSPLVRAKTMTWLTTCMPVVHIFSPLIRQPGTPSFSSRTARVSMKVASEPWLGSVRPKAALISPLSSLSAYLSYWALVANSLNISTKGLLPTMECSFCRSLCRPSPLAARCSRMIAMARFEPPLPPISVGQA